MALAHPRQRKTDRDDKALRQVVAQAQRGDQQAWTALVGRYSGLVWSVARAHRLGEADAADVSQATWVKLYEHLGDINEPAALGGWLATTARRECLQVLRRAERTIPSADMPDAVDDGPGLDAELLRSERDAELWRAFAGLGSRDRALLRLLAADPPASYEEIGAALDMPIGSIGPTRGRALARLARRLGRESSS